MSRPQKGSKLIGPYAKPKVRCSGCAYRPGTLQLQDAASIALDSPQWFTWLRQGIAFRVEQVYYPANGGQSYYLAYTVRPERRQRGGVYWYAYKKHNKRRLPVAYLGQSKAVTLTRLDQAALQFLDQINPELHAEVIHARTLTRKVPQPTGR
jgi:hypothetical protein